MPAPAWLALGATRLSSSRWASSRRPAHRLGRDRLLYAVVDGKRLQVRQRLLESQPLLVEVLAEAPQLERDLPARLLSAADYLDDLVEPAPVMRVQQLAAP